MYKEAYGFSPPPKQKPVAWASSEANQNPALWTPPTFVYSTPSENSAQTTQSTGS